MSDATTNSGNAADGPDRAGRLAGLADFLGMVLVLGGLILLFGQLSRNFFAAATLRSVLNQIPDLMVVSVGLTLVLVAGGIDLSVGSVLALSGSVLGVAAMHAGLPMPPAILAALLVGAGCGLATGLITVGFGLPSFIVTLGMLEMARGASYLVTDSQTQYIGPRVEAIARPIAGLGLSPAFLAAMAVVIAGHLVLTRTVWGRMMVAVGTNETAVMLSGLDPRPIKLLTFVISGLLAGLGAVFQVARLSSADPNAGVGLELAAIAAVVIGGTSLMGGRGSVIRTFLGVLIIAVLQTGLAQVGATEPTKRLITGAVIVLAVVADVHRGRWLRLGRRLRARSERAGGG